MKRVAIVGGAKSSRYLAPFSDSTIEIWSLNDMIEALPSCRPSRWFEMHRPDAIRAYRPEWGYLAKLASLPCPVYMCEAMPEIPNSRTYPLDQMISLYGGYFTNSVAYMLAMAISEGYEEIHLYGVEMSVSSEYILERPSVEYFVGLARGMGIKVYIPEISTLNHGYWLYGYDEANEVAAVRMEVPMPVRQIKILTSLAGEGFSFIAGDIVDASEMIAVDLIRAGYAEPLEKTQAGQGRDIQPATVEVAAVAPPEKAAPAKPKPRKKAGGGR
jgi:hypothetical protein